MFFDRGLETSITTGTGPYSLAGAPDGCVTFVAGIGNGLPAFYHAREQSDDTIWESGWGIVTDGSPDTLSRNFLASSTGGLISWVAGTRVIYSYPSGVALASLFTGFAGASRPPWLPAGNIWRKNSVTPWEFYFWDGTNETLIGTYDTTTRAWHTVLSSIDAGAGVGPIFKGYRNSASQTASDLLFQLLFTGRNDNSQDVDYADIVGLVAAVTDGAESGGLLFRTIAAGAFAERMRLLLGLQLGSPTGGDKGAGHLNVAGGLWSNGVRADRAGINPQTIDYTLAATDDGKLIKMDHATAKNLTAPPNSTVPLPVGFSCDVQQYNAGQTTLVQGAAVNIRSYGGRLKLAGQYATATLEKIATDEWLAAGLLVT